MKPIPYGRQHITDEDIKAVTAVLQSDYLTQGPEISKFENAFADYTKAQYAVAVSNGTAALHLCTLALNVKPGQKVITTPITFAASANCVRYCGGEVVFADIDPETYLLDINPVRELLQSAPAGTYAGIIPVDFAGRAVNLDAFRSLADAHNLWIIEDACHAPGGYFSDSQSKPQHCGNGAFADLAVFSFHPVKHIAAGEGGMITTNDESLYQKLLTLRTHGITKNEEDYQNLPELAIAEPRNSETAKQHYPNWYMEMQELGYNYRLTDFQAALGLSQLQRADSGLQRRLKIAARYQAAFADLPFITDLNNHPGHEGHAYHLYVVEVDNRLDLYNHLHAKKIYAQIHYIPLHLMPYYQNLGWKKGDLPNAEKYYERCISLPMYPTLTDKEQDWVIAVVRGFYEKR